MDLVSTFLQKMKLLYDLKKDDMVLGIFRNESVLVDSKYAYYHAGRSAMRLKKYDEAYSIFMKGLELDPMFSSIKLELVKYYSRVNPGDTKRSYELLKECIDSNPLEPAYWGVLGSIYHADGKYKKGAETYEKYLELAPNDHRAIVSLAVCRGELGFNDEALELYKKAISINPNYQLAYLNLAVHYSDLRMMDKAEETYRISLGMNPNSASTIYGLACVYALTDRVELALDYLEQSIEKDTKYKTYVLTDVDFEDLVEHPRLLEIIK